MEGSEDLADSSASKRRIEVAEHAQRETLDKYVKQFLSGDASAIQFFDRFLGLAQEGRSLSRCSSLWDMFRFLLALFGRDEIDEMSMRALMVLNEVLKIPECKAAVVSPDLVKSLGERLLGLLEYPEKHLAQVALETITTLIASDSEVFQMLARAGLLEKMRAVAETEVPDMRAKGQSVIGMAVMQVLKLEYTKEQESQIWDIIMFLVAGESEWGIRRGFLCMRNMIDRGFEIETSPEFTGLFVGYSERAPPAVLDAMFTVMAALYRCGYEDLFQELQQRGFYSNLFARVDAGEPNVEVYVFKFLHCVTVTPNSPTDEIIQSSLRIAAEGSLRGKTYAISYLFDLLSDQSLPGLLEFMVSQNFVSSLSSILVSRAHELLFPAVKILELIMRNLTAQGADLKAVPGIEELLSTLRDLVEDEETYEPLLTSIIHDIEACEA